MSGWKVCGLCDRRLASVMAAMNSTASSISRLASSGNAETIASTPRRRHRNRKHIVDGQGGGGGQAGSSPRFSLATM
jgi:hypothetical protein